MKYGITFFKFTANLGDDIQTYAAIKYLPSIDYVIEREALDTFYPDKKEYVSVIMNGWFIHNKLAFPPSDYIYPLLTSMHFAWDYNGIEYDYLSGYTKEKLEKFGKIGCRDMKTYETLKSLGYDVYFSGCLTLTIDRVDLPRSIEEDYICAVDLDESLYEFLESITNIKIVKTTHKVGEEEMKNLSFEERMDKVKRQLELYQNAKLVITTRLHVSLPCLGLNANVLLIYDENNEDVVNRIGTFKEYLNHMNHHEFLKVSEKELLEFKNKDDYKEIREKLEKEAYDFIEKTKEMNLDTGNLPDVDFFKKHVAKKVNFSKDLYNKTVKFTNQTITNMVTDIENYSSEIDNIKKSKSYKLATKISKILKIFNGGGY